MSARVRNLAILGVVALLLVAAGVGIATQKTILGLDLKGGVELVYQGRPTAAQPVVTQDALDRAVEIMRQRVDQLGALNPDIQRSGRAQLAVALPGVSDLQRAIRLVGTPAQLVFYDWETSVLGPDNKPVIDGINADDPTADAISQGGGFRQTGISLYAAVKQAAKRPASKPGVRLGPQYWAFAPKSHSFLAGPADTREELRGLRGYRAGAQVLVIQPGTVVLQAVTGKGENPIAGNRPQDAQWYVLKDQPRLLGKDVKDPKQDFDGGTGGTGNPDVTFKFTGTGRREFQDVTRAIAQRGQNIVSQAYPKGVNQNFAIALDNTLISVASIDRNQYPDGIDGANGAQISGSFTIQEAQDLAQLIKLGALPINLKLISTSNVSATLGKQALNQGLVAGGAGFLVVVLFLLLFYRVLGLIAALALGVYAVYFFALIKLIPITLTLPGIAGLILTIGVAADANIVIFERVKEEARAGKSVPAAIAAGYKKGLTAIIDANVVTIMTAFILFILATSEVKGFAFTLGIGTIVSLFTAVMATQAILGTMGRSRLISRPSALGAKGGGRRITFDFMGASRWFFSFSGVILLVGALAIGGRGLHFGIDFESGTRLQAALTKPADENSIRSLLSPLGYSDAKIQKFSNKQFGSNAFQITAKIAPEKVTRVRDALASRFGISSNARFQAQSVGPTFGQTVANSAVVAIIASLIVISLYIALRFEWKYAVPVLIALMHDLLITAGVYSLTGREVTTSTVAALLTILGYSLYDTIIVFDRVRENVPRMPRAAFSQIVNRSMSEVLTRSLATSFCTLLPILALLLFGGTTLKDFAFALLVGVASGAYSSIFIASPVLTHWKERESVYVARRHRIEAEHGTVPAYPTGRAGETVDLDSARPVSRRGRLTTPQEETLSRGEFESLKRDLVLDDEPPKPRPARPAPRRRATAVAEPPPEAAEPRPEGNGDGHAPDEAENDGMVARPPKPKKPRNRRHGRNR